MDAFPLHKNLVQRRHCGKSIDKLKIGLEFLQVLGCIFHGLCGSPTFSSSFVMEELVFALLFGSILYSIVVHDVPLIAGVDGEAASILCLR